MSTDDHLTYRIRLFDLRKYEGTRGTTYTVRWRVEHRDRQRTFPTHKLAESFRAKLVTATREGSPFDKRTGLPASMSGDTERRTWYEHACDFVDMKWAHASARHRKGIAEALAEVTCVLVRNHHGAPEKAELRAALFAWSFNKAARQGRPAGQIPPPDSHATAIRWVEVHSLPLVDLKEARTLRRALDAISLKRDGKPAAPATVTRKRSALYSALEYAVELEFLGSNPIDKVQWRRPTRTDAVDRRVVVNHSQAQALLEAVRKRNSPLEAFFACLYYAGLRPSEARHLRERDCDLPQQGWGTLLLVGSTQEAGQAWTDSGGANEDRQLKHRGSRDTRPVPAPPELVQILRRHIATFPSGPDGRLFVMRTGRAGVPLAAPFSKPLSMGTAYRAWDAARRATFCEAEYNSPLAKRPYDLRHACVSLWLNAGVPPTQVAEWAGHSVNVLLRVYAKCVYGQDHAAKARIEAALSADEVPPPGN